MPRRRRASKARIQPTLQDILALRGGTRRELVARFGSEEMALAFWRVHRADMLTRGHEVPELPPRWGNRVQSSPLT